MSLLRGEAFPSAVSRSSIAGLSPTLASFHSMFSTMTTHTKDAPKDLLQPFFLRPARPWDADRMASLIMLAMNEECCQYFAGPDHTLAEFHQMMVELIRRTDSQHSYRNALVAVDAEREVVGVIAGYDGACLHRLREPFLAATRRWFGRDFSDIADETQAGEYYIDSLAVDPSMRHQGVATALLRAVIRRETVHQPVGLLVDKGNPKAERLYKQVGFVYADDNEWGGHPMRHLVCQSL
jgi:ribosomal protein S18 acetylase RimI-like enzyme